MAAGRKSTTVGVALVAVVLLLAAAAADAQGCGVSWGTVSTCMSYCDSGRKARDDCCKPLKSANLKCLCDKYWNKLQSMPEYRDCADKLKNDCKISHSC